MFTDFGKSSEDGGQAGLVEKSFSRSRVAGGLEQFCLVLFFAFKGVSELSRLL